MSTSSLTPMLALALLCWSLAALAALHRRRAARAQAQAHEQQLRMLSLENPLLHLPHRAGFHQDIDCFIQNGLAFDLYYCVFQAPGIHDAQTVDDVAAVMAGRLRALARPGQLLLRHDRMEFLLLDPVEASVSSAPSLRNELVEACRQPLSLGAQSLRPRIHVGRARFPIDGSTPRQLLLAASCTPGPTANRGAELTLAAA